jgi:hypothetical protein
MRESFLRLAPPVGRAAGVFNRLLDRGPSFFAGALLLHTTMVCGLLFAAIWMQPG